MKLVTVEGTTYIRSDDGSTMATYNEAAQAIEIKRNSKCVVVDIAELLAKQGLEIVPCQQKFDNSE